jgi:acyl-CoA thioester hydrolase
MGRAGTLVDPLRSIRCAVRQPVLAEGGEIDREIDPVPQQARQPSARAVEHAFPKVPRAPDGRYSRGCAAELATLAPASVVALPDDRGTPATPCGAPATACAPATVPPPRRAFRPRPPLTPAPVPARTVPPRGAPGTALRRRSDAARGAGTLTATMPEPFVHVLRVRYGECDPQGVVFNANYFTYFDVALTELWRESVGPYTEMMAAGVDMVVAEASARYLAPAGFDDELEIDIVVTRLGTTSMVTRIEVTRDSTLVVEGQMRHVFIDAGSRRKIEIPSEIRRGLERHLTAEAGAWSTSG